MVECNKSGIKVADTVSDLMEGLNGCRDGVVDIYTLTHVAELSGKQLVKLMEMINYILDLYRKDKIPEHVAEKLVDKILEILETLEQK